MDGFTKVRAYFGSKFSEVFKIITTDNGSEFAELSKLETYITHILTLHGKKGAMRGITGWWSYVKI